MTAVLATVAALAVVTLLTVGEVGRARDDDAAVRAAGRFAMPLLAVFGVVVAARLLALL